LVEVLSQQDLAIESRHLFVVICELFFVELVYVLVLTRYLLELIFQVLVLNLFGSQLVLQLLVMMVDAGELELILLLDLVNFQTFLCFKVNPLLLELIAELTLRVTRNDHGLLILAHF
jgi:hypothetical protein